MTFTLWKGRFSHTILHILIRFKEAAVFVLWFVRHPWHIFLNYTLHVAIRILDFCTNLKWGKIKLSLALEC